MIRLPDSDASPGSLRRRLLTEPRRPPGVRASPRAHWYVVATVCIGAFMGQLDASIVTLALPRLGRDLHASVGAVEWVALAYLLVLVATVATVGRIADACGRKLLYVYGFGVFTAGSVLCGLAPTLPVLIAARALQAVGAAMLQANSVALITEALPPRLLGRGIGVQGTAQALGLALGPAVGGALLALGGWRLIFLVNLPAGAIGLALGWFLLPRSRTRRPIRGADRLGAVLLALGTAGPLVYLSLASHSGYASPALLVALAAGLLAAVSFVRREPRVDAPLIDLSILRRPGLAIGLSSGLVSYLVLFGTLFVIPYYLSARHVGYALIGLQLSVLPVGIGIAALLAGRLLNRVGGLPFTSGGLILAAVGLLEIALRHGTTGLLVGLALAGVGLGAFTPANNATIMSAAPQGHAGVVSGVLNMTRGIGTALGVALAAALYTTTVTASGVNASDEAAAHGLTVALAVLGLLALAVGVALLLRSGPRAGAQRRRREQPRAAGPPSHVRRRKRPHTRADHTSLARGGHGHERSSHGRGAVRALAARVGLRDNGPMRYVLSDEWQRTSAMSLAVAAIAGGRAATASPRWDFGDLLVGLYFAALSLLFWIRAARIRRGRALSRFAALRMTSLVLGLGVGAALALTDIATSGKL